MTAMEVDDPHSYQEKLAQSSRRGFRRRVAIALIVVGLVPVTALVLIRPPTPADAVLIATLFVLVPAAALLLWTVRDREARAARELVMWLRSASKSDVELPADAQAAFGDMSDQAQSLSETAEEVREALAPLVTAPGILAVRIAIYRFWYPILWVFLSLLVIGLYLAAITFGPPIPLGLIG
jgi:hypothetical protein